MSVFPEIFRLSRVGRKIKIKKLDKKEKEKNGKENVQFYCGLCRSFC